MTAQGRMPDIRGVYTLLRGGLCAGIDNSRAMGIRNVLHREGSI